MLRAIIAISVVSLFVLGHAPVTLAGENNCPVGYTVLDQPLSQGFGLDSQTIAQGATKRYCLSLTQGGVGRLVVAMEDRSASQCSRVSTSIVPPPASGLPPATSVSFAGWKLDTPTVGVYLVNVIGQTPGSGCGGVSTFAISWTTGAQQKFQIGNNAVAVTDLTIYQNPTTQSPVLATKSKGYVTFVQDGPQQSGDGVTWWQVYYGSNTSGAQYGWVTEDALENADNIPAPATYQAQLISQDTPTVLQPGETRTIHLTIKNIGSATWLVSPNRLTGDGSVFLRVSQEINLLVDWGKDNFYSTGKLPTDTPPGQTVTIPFQITAPVTGVYPIQWQLFVSSKAVLGGTGAIGPRIPLMTISVGNPTTASTACPDGYFKLDRNAIISARYGERLWGATARYINPGETNYFCAVVDTPQKREFTVIQGPGFNTSDDQTTVRMMTITPPPQSGLQIKQSTANSSSDGYQANPGIPPIPTGNYLIAVQWESSGCVPDLSTGYQCGGYTIAWNPNDHLLP